MSFSRKSGCKKPNLPVYCIQEKAKHEIGKTEKKRRPAFDIRQFEKGYDPSVRQDRNQTSHSRSDIEQDDMEKSQDKGSRSLLEILPSRER